MKPLFRGQTFPAGPHDGPEEGEIVSDDLEDISDESISFTPCNGKSLSRSDHLHALSLSSITDLEDNLPEKRRKRKKSERHTRRRKRSRRKLVGSDSSDDDNDTTLGRKLKLQLKAAVRVDVEEAHKNSLRTRLRAMVRCTGGPESEYSTTDQKLVENSINNIVSSTDNALSNRENDTSIIEIDSDSIVYSQDLKVIPSAPEIVLSSTDSHLSAPENIESGSEQSKDEIDSELIQLRLEALKTAINNKYANKKLSKKLDTVIITSDDTNKENTNNNSEENKVNKTVNKVEIPQVSPQSSIGAENDIPPSPDEDEDVLRALLLASISKKITSVEPEPTKTKIQLQPVSINFSKATVNKKTNINNYKLNNLKKFVNNVKNVVNKASGNTKLVKMPRVKPLIIQVNSNSDSDSDFSSSPEKSPKKLHKNSEIDLKIIPAENIAIKNLEVQNAIESSVDKFLREQRAKVESEIQTVNTISLETNKDNIVTNGVETKKSVITAIIANNNKLDAINVSKNAQCTKQTTSNTNKDSHSTNNITPNKNKQTVTNALQNSKNHLDKSALIFLPENKREEYKQLQNMLKLRRAQLKKPTRVRRASQRVSDSSNLKNKNEAMGTPNRLFTKTISQPNKVTSSNVSKLRVVPNTNSLTTPLLPKAKVNVVKLVKKNNNQSTQKMENASQVTKNEARSPEKINQQVKLETRNQERKSDALLLHTTLKQMQTRKDGRLQIQDRYKSLRPLIKKINDVSKVQKNWDLQVNNLLEQLAEARKRQQEAHVNMSAFVKELAERKQKMDESLAKPNKKPKINTLITSTPFKQNRPATPLDISAVSIVAVSSISSPSVSDQGASITIQNTVTDNNKNNTENKGEDFKKNDESMLNTWEQSTKLNNDNIATVTEVSNVKRVASDTDLYIFDPNDIDKIIRKTEEKVAVLEKKDSFECRRSEKVRYVSPLDSVKRKEDFDPFAIMCPFEVNGMCKDPECSFKHLPK